MSTLILIVVVVHAGDSNRFTFLNRLTVVLKCRMENQKIMNHFLNSCLLLVITSLFRVQVLLES